MRPVWRHSLTRIPKLRSARLWRVLAGVPPASRSTDSFHFVTAHEIERRVEGSELGTKFRQDAETDTRDACAPHSCFGVRVQAAFPRSRRAGAPQTPRLRTGGQHVRAHGPAHKNRASLAQLRIPRVPHFRAARPLACSLFSRSAGTANASVLPTLRCSNQPRSASPSKSSRAVS